MADEVALPPRLHPEDLARLEEAQKRQLAELADAIRNGPFRVPQRPDIEPPSGIDARVISEAVRAIVGEKVSAFLTRDQIVGLVDERLGRVGIRMDEDHIEETGEAIRGAMKWHRLASKAWWAALGTITIGFIYALARKAGLPVPTAP